MCEFCLKHGEGGKWYLQAKNYSDDLLSDIRRRRFIADFMTGNELRTGVERLQQLDKAPRSLRRLLSRMISTRMKRVHYGQVLPIEDIERIFGMVNYIVRTACICRHTTLGQEKRYCYGCRHTTLGQEKRYCYGVSLSPDGGEFVRIVRGLDKTFLGGPEAMGGEVLSREQALALFREHEQEGLCHSVWTFCTPFIGGICNCDRTDCMAMRCTVTHDVPIMFRAEYVAQVDPDACVGCRQCMRFCQFGAMAYSATNHKVAVDQRWCYGCGVCRCACPRNAIRLRERAQVPAAAHRW